MSLEKFMNEAISPWMRHDGPDSDIVLSSRIRLARNFSSQPFPTVARGEPLEEVLSFMDEHFTECSFREYEGLQLVKMDDLQPIEKRVLVEKHLVSPHLIEDRENAATIISENEQVSIMVNEEDHLRIQLYFPGFQLDKALEQASQLDDWLEEKIDYAFDEERGYLTACPTNVGTGMRASVMMHLPALALTKQINRMTPAINQLGLVVRGIYGEGSEAVGNLFQISNQITLGKSEEDIVEDLHSVVQQLIEQERKARQTLMNRSPVQLEDRIYRSYGTLRHSRVITSKEAAGCLSDLRLGIDLDFLKDIPRTILNELMVLTQPGFLQQYAGESLDPEERDIKRATLIRERINLEDDN
ncbi:protein arginine kinase [Salimicrobium humidisoli]|uniref:Protein-arginine kinase n=1 Tax=Salimicrobium humidisoli TaxID=2029857 RepID=A0ABX4HR12_9BACI|nr:protein arginine kinase [Salimicrobium humidisoli]PBB05274.1 protein arginine kinase [Salimicrobium humidisoli]